MTTLTMSDLQQAFPQLTRGEITFMLKRILTPTVNDSLPTASRPKTAGLIPVPLRHFPQIGGPDLATDDLVVQTKEFRLRWKASGDVTWIYVAGCLATANLAGELGLPFFKIGTGRDVQARLNQHKREEHAAWWMSPTGPVRDPGYGTRWDARVLPIGRALSPDSPIEPRERAIGVHLPVGLSAEEFEKLFSHALLGASLGRFVDGTFGRDYCRRVGIDPARFHRFTCYDYGSSLRRSACNELIVLKPEHHAIRLAAAALQVVVAFVMGGQA